MKIHAKITVIITLIVSGLLIGGYVYLNRNLREHTHEYIRQNLMRNLRLSVSLLNREQGADLAGQGDRLADLIGRDTGVRATIITMDGTVVGDSELPRQDIPAMENHLYRPEVQRALREGWGESERFSATVRKDFLYMAAVFGEPARQGIVRLAMPLADITHISQRVRRLIFAALLGSLLLAVAISFIASTYISQPIRQIAHGARAVAAGDFSRRISVSTGDEIQELAESFNYMSGQVKSRIEEVIENKSRLEAVFLSMIEGVMIIDRQGKISLMNESLKRTLGLDSDPRGKSPIEVIRNIEVQSLAVEAADLKRNVVSRELQILVPEEKHLMVHATAIVKEGTPEGAVLVFHDITELKRLEGVRRDFVANVSHELRTPISSIKGYAETLLGGAVADAENVQDFLEIIVHESNRLAALINDLLDLSRIESGKLQLALKPCRSSAVVDAVFAGFQRSITAKELRILQLIPADFPAILADEQRFSQVMVNLIDNAIKYTPAGGIITVKAEEKGEFICITVSDTGIGIPEHSLPRIFERFYRVDKARSRELGGTGLGLSIVKHIVQAHGGEVSVASSTKKGTVFTVTFPRGPDQIA